MPLKILIGPLRAPQKALMDAGGCMNMLHKDHIYVVQGYMIYICPIKFNNIYMMFKNIYMLLKKISCLV